MSRMFGKILIANRGEIACRVMRTCRRLGVRAVAVYSDADANALHVRVADEAVHIGGSPAQESYLSIPKIISAAQQTGADAIHPGYGFLSENEEFAEACSAAGIKFIGPPASAIRAMGSKSAAKALMQQAGVPLTPGYHGPEQAPEFLAEQADSIGYPVLIKASAGGGGKGMRRVDEAHDFAEALASCKREAAAAFGDDHVLIESYVLRPRHIEIQVFADEHGNVVSLFERDCSVQRRHQKVLEEAPAPGMSAERREQMGKAACDAARAVGYVGAGTVEFIAGPQGDFHFMEMNTRLQVEHPVTEMITGLDLVEWQLRVAAGEPLPLRQDQLQLNGHSVEARVYAEDPYNDFLPSIGKLTHFRSPTQTTHVRVDAGVEQGDEITAFYDPMIAKLIVWEPTREQALRTMARALGEFEIAGVKTNIEFLQRIVTTPSFSEARLDTALIDREKERLFAPSPEPPRRVLLSAALAQVLRERSATGFGSSPWDIGDGWRLAGTLRRNMRFQINGIERDVQIEYAVDEFQMTVNGETVDVRGSLRDDGTLMSTIGGRTAGVRVISAAGVDFLFDGEHRWEIRFIDPLAQQSGGETEESNLLSPMPGLLRSLLVEPGVYVEKGTPLAVMEAMKMEYAIKAPAEGAVAEFFFKAGDQVPESTQLLRFERGAKAGS